MASNFHFIYGKNYLFKFYQHLILSKKLQISGIMDMMKDMYDDGDENMKKIIGEAMLKSRSGEKPEPPKMPDY